MSESVPVLVVLSGEALDVIVTCLDGALLGPLILVGQHVRLQILEHLSTFRIRASSLLFRLFAAKGILAAV